jgi:CubicO group peptidase (beta-lactamase class C family)
LENASPNSLGFSGEKLEEIDRLFQSGVEQGNIAGAIALVARKGKIVYYHSEGYSDLANNTPLRKNAIFRIASQTKAVTSVAVMQLYEKGKLKLDDPIGQYLPEFGNQGILDEFNPTDSSYTTRPATREVTIRHLLTHTSGYAYPGGAGEAGNAIYAKAGIMNGVPSKGSTLSEEMRKVAALPLIHKPGERFTYGLSTDILGYLVEELTGKSLAEYFKTEIFEPLGMVDTYFHVPLEKQDRLMKLYQETPGEPGLSEVPAAVADYPRNENPCCSGGGGLSSTVLDYSRFIQMLLNQGEYNKHELLKPETVRLMRENHIGRLEAGSLFLPVSRDKYGLGFEVIFPNPADSTLIPKKSFGWGGAFGSLYWIDPVNDIIAQLVIQKAGEYQKLRYEFVNAVYGAYTNPKGDG